MIALTSQLTTIFYRTKSERQVNRGYMESHQEFYFRIKDEYRKKMLRKPEKMWPSDVCRALECINGDLFEYGFCVQLMRERCRIQQNNFSARFRFFTGNTPSRYIKKHRIECAKIIMEEIRNPGTVYGIALEVGYEYPSTFCGAFKNETGMTPADYRNFLKKK